MNKQFNFEGPQPKITISLNQDGTVRTDWAGVNDVVFFGMLETAKIAFVDQCKRIQLEAAMRGN